MEVFVVGPSFRCSPFMFSGGSAVRDVLERFFPQQLQDFYVSSNGHLSHLDDLLQHGAVYRLEPRLCGGKGGFGSMLRALGAQIEKTTNREACRDLSGRRLRDVNHEKEMADWLKQQAEREAEKEQRRLERLQRKMAEPKHTFSDPQFQQQCHDLSERLEDSVLKGLQASSSCQVNVTDGPAPKRPNMNQSDSPPMKKKKKTTTAVFWTGLEDLDESMSSEDDEGPSTSAVAVTMQREEAEPSSSTSPTTRPSDQRPPGPSCEDQRPSGPSCEDQRPPGLSCEDQRPPGPSCEDQRPSGPSCEDQRPPGPSCEDQRPPGPSCEDQRPPGHSCEDQRPPGPSSVDQRPPGPSCEDQRPPGPSCEDQRPPGPSSVDQRPPGPSCEDQRPPESSETSSPQSDPTTQDPVQQLDLSSVTRVQQLESLGLEVLKKELVSRGLKCGGTLSERAARLFSIRGLSPDQIDPVLLAKPVKSKKK